MSVFAFSLGAPELGVGIVQGLCYALLGLGLVLVYRASRIVHFGYGEIGAFGAVLLAKLVLDKHWPWFVALAFVVAIGAVIGAAWELLVVRRLTNAPRLMLLVATIAIAQLMLVFQLLVPTVTNRDLYPTGLTLRRPIGSFILRGDHVMVLIVVPLVAAALAWFLNRTKTGLAIRGATANADAASLAGVRVKRVSTIVWALAGALATLTFVLILPLRGFIIGGGTSALGPGLLLRAVVVGLIGRMESLTLAVAGGVAFGVVEAVLLSNVDSPGSVDMIIFVLLLVLLLARGAAGGEEGGFLSGRVRELPEHIAGLPLARRLSTGAVAAGVMVAAVLPLIVTNPARQFTFSKILVYALMGLSVTVVTGWGGQLSLCQFAFVGLGAFVTAGLTDRGMGFGPAAAFAVVITAATATLIGFPALRIRGLFLAMITLGFAVGAQGWLLQRSVFQDATGRVIVTRAQLGPIDFTNQRHYYYLCLACFVVVAVALARLRNSGVGRTIVAVRENEAAASAVTLSPANVKLVAFGLSGAVAGLAGALFGGLFVNLDVNTDFGPEKSVLLVTIAIIGGVGSVTGSVLGALYLIGVPNFFAGSTIASVLTSGLGLLVLILWLPGGLLEVVHRARNAILERVAGRAGTASAAPVDDGMPESPVARPSIRTLSVQARELPTASDPAKPVLSCREVSVRFGGLVANRDVSLEVAPGETVGLIGTNGAGKSTLMNAVGGYVPVAAGRIEVFGLDVTTWPAHARAELGMGRVFQDARLFGELTVRECVMVALEARQHSELVPSLLGLPPAVRAESVKRSVAEDVIELCGLGHYADAFVAELSTGTRRICELALLIAGGSRLILLDEPTAGVAQREVEAFGAVIVDVRRQLDASVLLIEHDIPLVMSLCDRIVCMTAGEVIATGSPEQIRNDPNVIAAYLGTDERAILRSDTMKAT